MTWTPTPSNGTSLLKGLISRGGPQTKKVAYLAGIAAGIVWLSIGLFIGIKPEWNVAFGLFLGAITTGYVGGKKVGAAASPAAGAQGLNPSDASDPSSAEIKP